MAHPLYRTKFFSVMFSMSSVENTILNHFVVGSYMSWNIIYRYELL